MNRARHAGVLGGLDRHRGALAVGAVEEETLAGRERQGVERAAGADAVLEAGVSDVQRAGDRAVPFALGALAQVDDDDIPAPDEGAGLGDARRPAA